jgi:hypothetical protein
MVKILVVPAVVRKNSVRPLPCNKQRRELCGFSRLPGDPAWKSQSNRSDELEQLRARLRKMTDAQLVGFGKAARSLCRDPKCPEVFKRQLEEAKTEWRRRHPKAQ